MATTKGRCALCAGELAYEELVYLVLWGKRSLCYKHAWVCKQCGTAWPVAHKIAPGGSVLKRNVVRLWEDGERADV